MYVSVLIQILHGSPYIIHYLGDLFLKLEVIICITVSLRVQYHYICFPVFLIFYLLHLNIMN
jgi:hypothetical protein